jgi:glutamine amidotransferase
MNSVTVVDYGMANLFNVGNAIRHCGADVVFADTAAGIDDAKWLILPGVGAFADGMEGLRERGLIEPVRRYARSGRPLLGICLGMQMLLDHSEEFDGAGGLGLIPGRVVRIPTQTADGAERRIPCIGWSQLLPPRGQNAAAWEGTILGETPPGAYCYFVHSFHAEPDNPAHLLAIAEYDGFDVTAAIRDGNIYGTQYHLEKSARRGLDMLARFLALEA